MIERRIGNVVVEIVGADRVRKNQIIPIGGSAAGRPVGGSVPVAAAAAAPGLVAAFAAGTRLRATPRTDVRSKCMILIFISHFQLAAG